MKIKYRVNPWIPLSLQALVKPEYKITDAMLLSGEDTTIYIEFSAEELRDKLISELLLLVNPKDILYLGVDDSTYNYTPMLKRGTIREFQEAIKKLEEEI